MHTFLFGSSYYPEWWEEVHWAEDFARMRRLGFNTVRMGEFAWSWYEPHQGEYHFAPMRRAVDLAAQYGIKTIMGTTTAVCPAWLHKKRCFALYPLRGKRRHSCYQHGVRHP